MREGASDVQGQIAQLMIYPVKSCAGVAVSEAVLLETGLQWDRHWMVVDAEGLFVSQRECARMALIRPQIEADALWLRAPGMPELRAPLQASGSSLRVQVWDDVVDALDMGPEPAQWLQTFLGAPAQRLVRFDPAAQRACSTKWTGGVAASTQFADGYPVLVTTDSAMGELNTRLAAQGHPAVGMARFRPNVVLSGLLPHDEDHLGPLDVWENGAAVAGLQLVKPCARCPIPNIDPATAESHPGVGDALQAYRQDARVHGAITFGMNAIVTRGAGTVLRVGQAVRGNYAFG
ncbi:MAG: MOSC N-terminal beta barrel domain-containing protein [Burkholderiaceae bacterium]|nr:MOSC N-terminal beta barrel domain-containing protein [Burkholderiaceae bacterium]